MDWVKRYHSELYHYGVKGMKWGVRRSREELRYNKNSVIASVNRLTVPVQLANGTIIAKMSDHAGDQIRSRKVDAKGIVDALRHPMYTSPVVLDKEGRPSQRLIGKKATVNVNPDTGIVTTLWQTGRAKIKKYSKGE